MFSLYHVLTNLSDTSNYTIKGEISGVARPNGCYTDADNWYPTTLWPYSESDYAEAVDSMCTETKFLVREGTDTHCFNQLFKYPVLIRIYIFGLLQILPGKMSLFSAILKSRKPQNWCITSFMYFMCPKNVICCENSMFCGFYHKKIFKKYFIWPGKTLYFVWYPKIIFHKSMITTADIWPELSISSLFSHKYLYTSVYFDVEFKHFIIKTFRAIFRFNFKNWIQLL